MNIKRAFSIKGIGSYLPSTSVLSAEIEAELNLPKDFIYKNLGVNQRHKARSETNTFMGEKALREALEDANMTISSIDCLIGAAATFDYVIPNRSTLIKNAFAEADTLDFPCVDVNTVCTSFISALDYASLLLQTGDYQNIAIVSSESSLKGLDSHDIETYGLFGDGAAAIILSKTKEEAGLIKYQSKTYAKGAKYTIIEGGGNVNHVKDVPYESAVYSFKMQGLKLLKMAKATLPKYLSAFFSNQEIALKNVDLIIPHQASKLGIKMLVDLNDGQSKNIVNELANYGNCIAASIPLALVNSIKSNRLKEGDCCFLLGTAAGMTISGLLFKYTKL